VSNRPKIVLVAPEIPGNTGSIGRTCVALDMELILIKPYGFELSDKSVRRAGLDYWKHVDLTEFDTWKHFMETRKPDPEGTFFFEEFGSQSIYDVDFPSDPYLVFGRETKGLPKDLVSQVEDRLVNLPMRSEHIRSLNLANTVTAVAYQVLRGAF
jgi:tRNA (cytidine/uridine-2'-O-)-methyltransferase